MQRGEQQFFKDRSLYYATFPIREQGQKGEWDYRLKAVYVIGILNFTFDEQSDDFYHHERNLSRLMERPKALQERIFTKLFEAAEIAKFTKTEYDNYEESLKIYRDWKNTIDTAKIKSKEEGRKEGLKEGEKIGIEKGKKEKAIEIAKQLKAESVPVDIIIKCSGLSEEEINSL